MEDVCFERITIGRANGLQNDNDHIHWDNLRRLTLGLSTSKNTHYVKNFFR